MSPEADQSTDDKQCAPNSNDTQRIKKNLNIFFTTENALLCTSAMDFSIETGPVDSPVETEQTDLDSWAYDANRTTGGCENR